MDLKSTLQDYSRAEFSHLLGTLMAVTVPEPEHDALIQHLDQILGHPRGTDLIFYPLPDDSAGLDRLGTVLHHVRHWHHQQGQLAFSDDALPAPKQAPPQLDAAQRAQQMLAARLAKAEQASTAAEQAQQALEAAFAALAAWQANVEPLLAAQAGAQPRATLEQALSGYDDASVAVTHAIATHRRLGMAVQAALSEAQLNQGLPYADRAEEGRLLEQASASQQRYQAQQVANGERQRALHGPSRGLVLALEQRLIEAATASRFGPRHEPQHFTAALAQADQSSWLLTPHRAVRQALQAHLAPLRQALRSAATGLTWQAHEQRADGPPQQACVIAFDYARPGLGEPYALSLPLAELLPVEGRDWALIAEQGGEVSLPLRVSTGVGPLRHGMAFDGLEPIVECAELCVVATGSPVVCAGVRVGRAVADGAGGYRFDHPGGSLTWQAVAALPEDGPLPRGQSMRAGNIQVINVPVVEPMPRPEGFYCDDYVVVFPEEVGLAPLYVVFKSRAEYPE